MILKTLWINFLQYMNNNVVKGKKYYEISFVITGKLYKVLVEVKRGPEDIIQISDENYDDVTEVLIPYFRAQRSTIVNLTPKILEHENLQFLTASEDDPYNFSNDEFIRLKKE